MSADAAGVAYGYTDLGGVWHDTDRSVRAALHAALGSDIDAPDAHLSRIIRAAHVVHRGERWHAPAHGTLAVDHAALPDPGAPAGPGTERGAQVRLAAGEALPEGLGFGEHRFTGDDGISLDVIHAPASAHLPADLWRWGWAVQLYALRSRDGWGMGDLGGLARLARHTHERHGAGMLLVNPLHANAPVRPVEPSPYFPSSRCFRNPLYLDVRALPGAAEAAAELAPHAALAAATNGAPRIERDVVHEAKYGAFAILWERFRARRGPEHDAFTAFRAAAGAPLDDFARFCAIAEVHGGDWRAWPVELTDRASSAVTRFADAHADRVAMHAWLQWCLDVQLAGVAATGIDLMTDLAVGVDRAGADAWVWPDAFCSTLSIGAPPDTFNTQGQNWGLPPLHPHRLAASGYGPFRAMVRAAFAHARGVRIDHVMGLFRLWCVPDGEPPTRGCYVYLPFRDLTGIIALESLRASAYVVGEDLGTVEPYMRDELAVRRFLSTKLLEFEDTPARHLPVHALTAVTTHDLPTVAGLWSGSDLADQQRLGLAPNEAGTAHTRAQIARRADAADDAAVDAVVLGVHRELAQAPSALVTATIEDALGVAQRPNMPGTVDEWPNWRIPLPRTLDDVIEQDLLDPLARVLAAGRARPVGDDGDPAVGSPS